MVRYGPKDVVKWTNIFPPKGLVSKTYSSREILTAKPLDYKNICQMRFLSYGQSIHETNPADMTTPRTLGVIYLWALDTLQGGFEVMNLLTGKIIYSRNFTPIQITQEVIDGVEALSKRGVVKSPLKLKYHKEEKHLRTMMKMMTTMVQSQE